MDEQCCVDGCYNVKEDLFYFKLPGSRALRKKWLEAINSTVKLTDEAVVCSRHFTEEQYTFIRGKHRLKPRVVPCVFDNVQKKTVNQENVELSNNGTTSDKDESDRETEKLRERDKSPEEPKEKREDSPQKDKENAQSEDKSTQPEYESSQPGDKSSQLEDKRSQPEDKSSQSGDKSLQPEDKSTQPEDKSSRPEDKSSQPGDKSLQPGDKSSQPEKKSAQTEEKTKRKAKKRREENKRDSSPDSRSPPRNVQKTQDLEFSPNKDIEEILTNYHIKLDRPLSEIAAERQSEMDRLRESEREKERELEPKYLEVAVGEKNQEQSNDCLMLLEDMQVEIDPSLFPEREEEEPVEEVDLDRDSSSDCIDLGEKKEDPISLLSSSDESDVIIQEPKIDVVEVSDATDEDDIPLLKLAKIRKKRPKNAKTAAINKIMLYKCDSCDYSSVDATDLEEHTKKHTNIRICDHCNYMTSSWSMMRRHREKHNKSNKTSIKNMRKKYKCPLCSYRAKHNMSLVYHMGTHSVKKAFKCENCDFFTNIKEEFTKHIDACKDTYNCNFCEYKTVRKSSLKKHLNKKHTDEVHDEDYVPSRF